MTHVQHRSMIHLLGAPAQPLLACLGLILPLACAGSGPEAELGDTISRQLFIDTYVELRVTALRNPLGELTPQRREQILGEREVTEQQLLDFAYFHGRELDFMRDIWEDVEARLDSIRESGSEDGSPGG